MTVTGQANGFYISGKSWITVSGFTLTGTTDHGLYVSSESSHITLADNHVTSAGDTAPGQTEIGDLLQQCQRLLDRRQHRPTTTPVTASTSHPGRPATWSDGNSSFSNAMGYQRGGLGIRVYSSPGNTISTTSPTTTRTPGSSSTPAATTTWSLDNVIYNNGDHGIDDLNVDRRDGSSRNTVYQQRAPAGINVEGNSTGATIANNISVDNGIKSPRTARQHPGRVRLDRRAPRSTTTWST